jgi:hypothetical protein
VTTPDLDQSSSPNGTAPSSVPASRGPAVDMRLVAAGIVAIATVSGAMTYFLIRQTLRRVAPVDPTSERIQALIDEANALLRTLDDKKPR